MRASVCTCCVTAILLTVSSLSAAPKALPKTPDEIDAAIARGRAFLYSLQKDDGTWEDGAPPPPGPLKKTPDDKGASVDNNQYGSKTALAVYVLLEAGESPTEPKLKKAVDAMQKSPSVSTYTLSLRCLCWSELPPTSEVKAALRRDAAALIAGKRAQGINAVWDWATFQPPRKGYWSLTNTQAAAWGLYAAVQADYEVAPDIWKGIDKTFETGQLPDGGWGNTAPDKKKDPPKASMFNTATGVAALLQAQDYSRADAYGAARGNASNPAIDKGLAWIAKNFAPLTAADKAAGADKTIASESPFRRWYGIEHAALISGLRKFGDHDWYAEGVGYFLKAQNKKDGNWGAPSAAGDYRLTDTAWAMLYLSRGRLPVAMNKLDYTPASAEAKKALWNQRPRDVANAAAWVERATERELRWQVVTTDDTPAALLEAPVLYLSGGDTLDLKPEAKEKLKTYVNSGGLILANADAANANFAKSVEKLGLELVPSAEWRDLPETHPLFANEIFKKQQFRTRPNVRAIGNGVREFVMLVPTADPAKSWQLKSARANGDAWQLVADVISYATDKSNFYARGETWLAADTTAKVKHAVKIARLKYGRGWDPEPLAFAQLDKFARARDWGVATSELAPGDAVPAGTTAVWVSGTAAFTLDDATRTGLKAYMDGGGCVVFEAAGGSAAFAASAQSELTRWYGADALATLPPEHALYKADKLPADKAAGDKLAVGFRPFALNRVDQTGVPQLRGVEQKGKVVALLSREDLSAGLLGVPTDGIVGYAPATARTLTLRVLANLR